MSWGCAATRVVSGSRCHAVVSIFMAAVGVGQHTLQPGVKWIWKQTGASSRDSSGKILFFSHRAPSRPSSPAAECVKLNVSSLKRSLLWQVLNRCSIHCSYYEPHLGHTWCVSDMMKKLDYLDSLVRSQRVMKLLVWKGDWWYDNSFNEAMCNSISHSLSLS